LPSQAGAQHTPLAQTSFSAHGQSGAQVAQLSFFWALHMPSPQAPPAQVVRSVQYTQTSVQQSP